MRRLGVAIAALSVLGGLVSAAEGSMGTAAKLRVVHVRCAVRGRHGLIPAVKSANRAEGGVLKLAKGCTYTLKRPANKIDGGNGLPVLKGRITLRGKAGTTIARSRRPGTPHFRILEVGKRGRVAISRLVLTGGRLKRVEFAGGAIENKGTISISHDLIRRNRAPAGGGIDNIGTIVRLDHTRISRNTAANGGGVFNLGTIRKFGTATISSNRAAVGGGITNSGGSILSLNHSTISGNHLTGDGAGGGIANVFGALHMSQDKVIHNTATAGPLASGGGIDNSGELELTASVVRDNMARGVGGGVRNEEQVGSLFVVHMRSTSVLGNTVTSPNGPATGGGIFNAGAMSVVNSSVRGNKATASTGRAVGAGLYNDGRLSVIGTATSGNIADNQGGEAEGGGLYIDENSTYTSLVGSTVNANKALGPHPHGGGIYYFGGASPILESSTVTGNTPDNCYPHGTVTGC